jgi:hypothetical protein
MKEAPGGEMGAVWNRQLRAECCSALLLDQRTMPMLIRLSATHH